MFDVTTGSQVVVSHDEKKLGDGGCFKIDDLQNVSTTTKKWMVTTPNTKVYARMIFDILCTGEMLTLITEGADRTGTTLLTPINRNRVGTPAAATVVVHRDISGGATDGATPIKTFRLGATDKFSALPGEAQGRRGYVLKPNTKYVISVTTYGNVYVTMRLHWCEHVDRRMQEHYNVER